ncbi:acyl-coenzyme A thioesterase THEM4-like isoform X1 [Montipora foliosa]|uniref:acyl-coenzyme A thioesterase THEM4-like isoform X1 n=2 Tax=Montipora foliosa TaxID=591990 RepID=UPI0035F1C577
MALALIRVTTHRSVSPCSSSFFIPLATQTFTVVLKAQLCGHHFTSFRIPSFHCRGLSTLKLASRSRGKILTQTHGMLSDRSSRSSGCRYSSGEQASIKPSSEMTEPEAHISLPTASWGPVAIELYTRLYSDLIQNGDGSWIERKSISHLNGERRLFTKAAISELPGKFFEYQHFCNTKEQRLKGVIQFGPYTQGPEGCVHGGASAAMMDSAIGVCVNRSFSHCVTASLTTNYKSLLPLGATALVESWIDKVEGRKIFASAELTSPDGKITYVTANALFIQFEPNGKNKDAASKLKQMLENPS